MPAMLRGAVASTQARDNMRSRAPQLARAMLQSSAPTQTYRETTDRNRIERRAHYHAGRRNIHGLLDEDAAARVSRQTQERLANLPAKAMIHLLPRPVPTPQRVFRYPHHFLSARNEPSLTPPPRTGSLEELDRRAIFVLRMHGVEINRSLLTMHHACGIDGIFEQGAATLIDCFSKSLPSFRHFYKHYRHLPEDVDKSTNIYWDWHFLEALYRFFYDMMAQTTALPAKFIEIVEELECIAIKAQFPVPLPTLHDVDFRDQWKCQNETYVINHNDDKDVDMSNTALEHQQPAQPTVAWQNAFSRHRTSSGSDTDMSDAPDLPALQSGASFLALTQAASTTPLGGSSKQPTSNSFFTTQPAAQDTGQPSQIAQSLWAQAKPAGSSLPAFPTPPATLGAMSGLRTKPTGLLTSVHAANATSSAPAPAATTSSKAAAKSLFSTTFTDADHLVQALESQVCIAEMQAEGTRIGSIVLNDRTLRMDHHPFLKTSLETVFKWKGKDIARPAIAKATGWQSEMKSLRVSLQNLSRSRMQSDAKKFFDTLGPVLDWLDGFSAPAAPNLAPTPAALSSTTGGSRSQGISGTSSPATSIGVSAPCVFAAPAASSFTNNASGGQSVSGLAPPSSSNLTAKSGAASRPIAAPSTRRGKHGPTTGLSSCPIASFSNAVPQFDTFPETIDPPPSDGRGKRSRVTSDPAPGSSSSPTASSGNSVPKFATMPSRLAPLPSADGASDVPHRNSVGLFSNGFVDTDNLVANLNMPAFKKEFKAEDDELRQRMATGAPITNDHMSLLNASTAAVRDDLTKGTCDHKKIYKTKWYDAIADLFRQMIEDEEFEEDFKKWPAYYELKRRLMHIFLAIKKVVKPRSKPVTLSVFNTEFTSSEQLTKALSSKTFLEELEAEFVWFEEHLTARVPVQEGDIPLFNASIRTVWGCYEEDWFDHAAPVGMWRIKLNMFGENISIFADSSDAEIKAYYSKLKSPIDLKGKIEDIDDGIKAAREAAAASAAPPTDSYTSYASNNTVVRPGVDASSSSTSFAATSTAFQPGFGAARAFTSLPPTSAPPSQEVFTLQNKGKQRAGTPANTTHTPTFPSSAPGLTTGGDAMSDDDYELKT